MRVYRLEQDNYGPFCSQSELEAKYSSDSLYAAMGPQCASYTRSNKDYRSACESLDQLIEYFGSDFADLLSQGASIVEYNIDKRHIEWPIYDQWVEIAFKVAKVKQRNVILEGEKCKKSPTSGQSVIKPSYTIYSALDQYRWVLSKSSTGLSIELSATPRQQLLVTSQ